MHFIKKANFHNEIKKLRTQHKMSQRSFADSLEVSLTTVQNWENGRTFPYDATCQLIIEKFKLTQGEWSRLFTVEVPAEKRKSAIEKYYPAIKTALIGAAVWFVLLIISLVVAWNIYYIAEFDNFINSNRDLIIYAACYQFLLLAVVEANAFGIYFARALTERLKKADKADRSLKNLADSSKKDIKFALRSFVMPAAVWLEVIADSFIVFAAFSIFCGFAIFSYWLVLFALEVTIFIAYIACTLIGRWLKADNDDRSLKNRVDLPKKNIKLALRPLVMPAAIWLEVITVSFIIFMAWNIYYGFAIFEYRQLPQIIIAYMLVTLLVTMEVAYVFRFIRKREKAFIDRAEDAPTK